MDEQEKALQDEPARAVCQGIIPPTGQGEENDSNPVTAQLSRDSSGPPYTIFTRSEKILIVGLGSMATFLSPVTANIYYPAIPILSQDLKVSNNLINLTITVYLIFQGLAPTFVGSFSDVTGRRPAYLICFVLYLAANLGLALQDSFAALMVLRCLQSSGSSGTVALGNAMVSDIATSSERGSYIGYSSMGALLGPTLGPIIGGLLNQFLGWRAIFWFLFIFSAVILLIYLILLPETCRKVVGNGSIPAQKWNISLLTYLKQREQRKKGEVPDPLPPLPKKRPNFLGTITIIFSKEGGCVLIYTGLLFGGFYTIAASIPSDFSRVYHFNSLEVGLCYIPLGIGSLTAAVATGRTVDWNFRRHARLLNFNITKGKQANLRNFPIEKARIQVVAPLIILGSLTMIAYGWVMHSTRHLAGPLVLLYFLGASISGSFSALSTLMIDLYPESPGTATAANNLMRCWIGAAAVAGIGPLLDNIGTGWASLIVAGIWLLFSPILLLVYNRGPQWREEKRVRDEKKKAEDIENASRGVAEPKLATGKSSEKGVGEAPKDSK
jgi:multidrug resistance protein